MCHGLLFFVYLQFASAGKIIMTKKLNIPDELHGLFHKLVQLLPYQLQSDVDTQNIILIYLKLGGEKMARHGIKILKMHFLEEMLNYVEELSDPDAIDSEVEATGDSDAMDYSDSGYLDDDDDDDDDSDDYPVLV